MSRVRSRDTVAELAIRQRLWAMGLRYRVRTNLPGRPDIVFPRQRIAIFVDGDFWHGNSWRVRGLPSFEAQFVNRSQWWIDKIRRNMTRDQVVTQQLQELGWQVLRFWESDVLAQPNEVVARVVHLIRPALSKIEYRDATKLERRRLSSVTARDYRETYLVGRSTISADTADPKR